MEWFENKGKEHPHAVFYKEWNWIVYPCFGSVGIEIDLGYKIFSEVGLLKGARLKWSGHHEIGRGDQLDGIGVWQDDDRFEKLVWCVT